MQLEVKVARLRCMSDIAASPGGSFGPRESELQRSDQLEFVNEGGANKVFSKRGSESASIQPRRIRRSSYENTFESGRGAIARLLSIERSKRP